MLSAISKDDFRLSNLGKTTLGKKRLRACRTSSATAFVRSSFLLAVLLAILVAPCQAAYVYWENCLDSATQINHARLQWLPDSVSAKFNTTAPNYNLNITAYGNVVGHAAQRELPDQNDTAWSNPNVTDGKIPDQDPDTNKLSTLFARFNVLGYTPYRGDAQRFCENVVNRECPIAPDFTPG